MASKYWIKLYHEILDDPKMGRLPDALFRRAIEFFLMAGENGRDGGLPPLADMVWRLRADETDLLAQMEDLETLNILSRDIQGVWRVTHFAKRQAPSPMTERVRRHREAERSAPFKPDEAGNADVTNCYTDTDVRGLHEQAPDIPTPLRPSKVRACARTVDTREQQPHAAEAKVQGARAMGIGNADVTNCYTDTDTDTDKDKEIEKEADAEEAPAARGTNFADENLVKLFVGLTGLPLYLGGEEKWTRALERMKKAGVGEADLEQAIDECRSKGLTIASLASLVNPAIIAMSHRRAGRPEEDYRRYLKGEYGDFGR